MGCNRVIAKVNRTYGWELVLLNTIPCMFSEFLVDAQRFEQRIYYFGSFIVKLILACQT